MPNSIVRGFTQLTRFSGRDTRAQFWPYAGVVTALYIVVGPAVLGPLVLSVADSAQLQSEAEFQNVLGRFLAMNLLMFAVLVALLAAAVARRLHDSGRSALWGLLPLPFAIYSGVMFFRLISQFMSEAPDLTLFFTVFASNMLYLVALVTLIVLLALRSAPGENRYG